MVASLLVHFLLLFLATAWVVSVSLSKKPEPNSFVAGSGGAASGARSASAQYKVKATAPKSLTKTTRLVAKDSSSGIVLPEIANPSFAGLLSAAGANISAKGFGSGRLGGLGVTAGSGPGRSFTGKTVMGMRIAGSKIAVYFDDSPSMSPYLDAVEKQIKDQFPTADVFRYYGIFFFIEDGEIIGSDAAKKYQMPTVNQIVETRRLRATVGTAVAKLSPGGKSIFTSHDLNFRQGGVGAWLNYMQTQNYDALVIFSDFEDGVQQFRLAKESRPKLVYDPDQYPPFDERTLEEKAWETRWIRQFKKSAERKAPRLYLYSTAAQPQPIYKLCVQASGGEFRLIQLPKTTTAPPPRPKKK